ncbi:MAG: NAD(P)H-dependent oxidoreductase subunit E [Alphaproteobacteria bacterium]|nr:NAD(P)H-dependent oxidoreductase subunit E [Alphaproteobacteria bacterium]MBU0888138.1 NAD(P)H-dependent oxidoreductase subunit E [Alphaproteobacteria bacterium]MBU1811583.1 NAD(P)H-dependent oxidoreductase subunit E [Alphaproteobacteria bacterium]
MPNGTPDPDNASGKAVITPRRPGRDGDKGRRKASAFAKGRLVDERAIAEVDWLLTDRLNHRDLLIEHLHAIQDHYGHISVRHLAALAHLMRLPMAEVYEVATFYAHFDVLREDDDIPEQLTIRVCDSLTCGLMGAEAIIAELEANPPPGKRILRAPCMGACDRAPVAAYNHVQIPRCTASMIREGGPFVLDEAPPYDSLDAYIAGGGYEELTDLREGRLTPEAIIGQLKQSGLRGLGGAGFPTDRKWALVRSQPGPKFMAVNADEGEPGTFKDRFYMESDPHRLFEGMLIGATVTGCQDIYLYLRDEYPHLRAVLAAELHHLREAGLLGDIQVHVRRGAGAYICGEESAMIESIEGKRGLPRHRPPYVAEKGLFGRPTLVNNVETLFWVRDILQDGPDWFAGLGRRGHKGIRAFSVSGRVREPGVKLAPAGITARELIEEFCGGMAEGHTFKAYLPGGASGGILPASLADIPLDFGTLVEHDSFVGSHAVIILSDRDNTADAALNLMRFFAEESCGQCTPCRLGTEKAAQLMAQPDWDEPLLRDLARAMADASICGLGQAAPNPMLSVLTHFPEDVAARDS